MWRAVIKDRKKEGEKECTLDVLVLVFVLVYVLVLLLERVLVLVLVYALALVCVVPEGQFKHDDDPVVFAYVPAAQGVHVAWHPLDQVPTGQLMHVADPGDLEYDPLGQLREEEGSEEERGERRGQDRRKKEEGNGTVLRMEMGQGKNWNGHTDESAWNI